MNKNTIETQILMFVVFDTLWNSIWVEQNLINITLLSYK